MFRKLPVLALSLLILIACGCGTSTGGPGGSKRQTQTGRSENGYPAGRPADSESPALGSSSEQQHSEVAPKVPKAN